MAEDTGQDATLTAGLSTDDITPSVYEGGFKTWECSIDLARYLLSTYKDEESATAQAAGTHIIEVSNPSPQTRLFQLHPGPPLPSPTQSGPPSALPLDQQRTP